MLGSGIDEGTRQTHDSSGGTSKTDIDVAGMMCQEPSASSFSNCPGTSPSHTRRP